MLKMEESENKPVSTYQVRNETNIEERSASEEVNVLVSSSSYWYGPLPSSNELAEYERLIPGGAREILEMAKAEMGNRRVSFYRFFLSSSARDLARSRAMLAPIRFCFASQ